MSVQKINELNLHTKPDETNNDYVSWDEYITDNFENIKEVVNNNADELTNLQEKNSANETNITKIEEDIENIKKKNTEQDESISEIKEEQTTQNTNIDNLTKQTEELKQENALLKSQIPKGRANGEYIQLNNNSNMPYIDFKINGKSEQETREGYNLYNVNDKHKQYFDNSAVIDNNDYITINFDNTKGEYNKYVNVWTNLSKELKTNTKYKIILEIKSVNGMGSLQVVNLGPNEMSQFTNTIGYNLNTLKNGDIKIFEATTLESFENSSNMLRTYVVYQSGDSGSITFRISVLEDTTVTEDTFVYEPYGVMPSPEFPSEIRNCGDNINEFNYNNTTVLSTSNFSKIGDIENGYWYKGNESTEREFANSRGWLRIKGFEFKAYTKYYLSFNLKQISEGFSNKMYLMTCNVSDNAPNLLKPFEINSKNQRYYFELDNIEDDADLTFSLNSNEVQITDISISKVKNKYYSPYGWGNVNTIILNKNWIDLNNVQTFNNCIVTTENEVLKITDVNTSNPRIVVNCNLPAGKYYLHLDRNGTSPTLNVALKNMQGKVVMPNKGASEVIELMETATTMEINSAGTSGNFEIPFSKLYLNRGEVDIGYTPHQGQDIVIQTKPLRSLPNGVCDVKEKDKTTRRVGRKVLDGTELWRQNDNYPSWLSLIDNCYGGWTIQNAICSHFKWNREEAYYGRLNAFVISETGYIYIGTPEINDLQEFKAFLAEQYAKGTPVTIDYELAEPIIEEPCEELANVSGYKGVTNITSGGEVKPKLEVEYYKDLEAEHEKLQAKDNNLQQQINEIKELLSATQTSAMLLNNLEKDLIEEV